MLQSHKNAYLPGDEHWNANFSGHTDGVLGIQFCIFVTVACTVGYENHEKFSLRFKLRVHATYQPSLGPN